VPVGKSILPCQSAMVVLRNKNWAIYGISESKGTTGQSRFIRRAFVADRPCAKRDRLYQSILYASGYFSSLPGSPIRLVALANSPPTTPPGNGTVCKL